MIHKKRILNDTKETVLNRNVSFCAHEQSQNEHKMCVMLAYKDILCEL